MTSLEMDPLEGEGIHQPARHARRDNKAAEQHASQEQLLPRIVFRENRENEGDEEREDDEKQQVTLHYFLPAATSYTSMTTRRLRSPATIKYVLPYSYVTARTSPAP